MDRSLMFIPRYTPTALGGFAREPADEALPEGYRRLYFLSAREALRYFLENLKKTRNQNRVVITPYICSVVIDVLNYLNLEIVYADLRKNSIFQDNEILKNKIDSQTLAVILAPYFGIYSPSGLNVKPLVGDAVFILDFAQCAGCPFEDFAPDAVLFSYGMGKGADFYGGSLVYRDQYADGLETQNTSPESRARALLTAAIVLVQWAILNSRFLSRLLSKMIDISSQQNKTYKMTRGNVFLSPWARKLLMSRIEHFKSTHALSRKRARELYEVNGLDRLLMDPKEIDFDKSVFLRFPLLPRTSGEWDSLLRFFEKNNIEITRADEKAPRDGELDHFREVNDKILKLPYLGNLSEEEFLYLKSVVQAWFREGGHVR